MYLNGKAIFKNSKENKSYDVEVLLADVFDTNNCFNAMMMIDVDLGDHISSDIDITEDIFNQINKCDIFCCTNIDFGKTFDIEMKDIYIDVDYGSGSIVRAYLSVEDESTQTTVTIR